jgi:capsular polysaccharide biosynthesis protein
MNMSRGEIPMNQNELMSTARVVEDDEMEIDLIDLGYYILEHLHNVILCFLAGALLFNLYAYCMIPPTYESTAELYVVSSSTDSVVDLTDLNIGTSLTSDYEVLILGHTVLDRVIKNQNLDMDTEALKQMISLNNPTDSRVLQITVTSTSAKQARDIANEIAKVSVKYLPETMNTLAPNISNEARLADHKSGPSYTKYTMIGAIIGAGLYLAYLVFGYLMDDTVHDAEDLEKYFGLVPLTTIPENEQFRQEDGASQDEMKKRKGLFRKGKN